MYLYVVFLLLTSGQEFRTNEVFDTEAQCLIRAHQLHLHGNVMAAYCMRKGSK